MSILFFFFILLLHQLLVVIYNIHQKYGSIWQTTTRFLPVKNILSDFQRRFEVRFLGTDMLKLWYFEWFQWRFEVRFLGTDMQKLWYFELFSVTIWGAFFQDSWKKTHVISPIKIQKSAFFSWFWNKSFSKIKVVWYFEWF